jgi:small subunit ribosomal protein S6
LKDYECAVIFAPTVTGDLLADSTKRYADIITSRGGELKEIDDWGRRSLAYEINYHREGHYLFYRFKGGNDILSELKRQLRIDENVIRHMIVRDEFKGRAEYKPAEDAAEAPVARHDDAEEDS